MTFTLSSRCATPVLALSLIVGGIGAAVAQPAAGNAGGAAPSQQDRAACLSGKSGQDQATCLRELAAAREEARKGHLDTGHSQLQSNRTDRCKPLQGADQADCYARMRGEGTVEGSVKGGGVIREKRTVIPGDAAGRARAPGAAAPGGAGSAAVGSAGRASAPGAGTVR